MFYNFFLIIIYKRWVIKLIIKEVILNKAKDYYKNNIEKLREEARNKYRNLLEEEKIKKREDEKKQIS